MKVFNNLVLRTIALVAFVAGLLGALGTAGALLNWDLPVRDLVVAGVLLLVGSVLSGNLSDLSPTGVVLRAVAVVGVLVCVAGLVGVVTVAAPAVFALHWAAWATVLKVGAFVVVGGFVAHAASARPV